MAIAIILLIVVSFAAFTAGVGLTYQVAEKKGYETALTDVTELLKQKGIELQWEDLGNGKYSVQVISGGKLEYATTFEMHLLVQHFDAFGNLISKTYHTMTVVDNGKDWVEQQLFNPNATEKALYLAVSNDSSVVDTGWTSIPNEITDGGLERALGAYTDTGVGAANVTKTFSVSATRSTKLYGIYYYSGTSATLISAEQQGEGSQKNMNSGDSLKLTVQWSHL